MLALEDAHIGGVAQAEAGIGEVGLELAAIVGGMADLDISAGKIAAQHRPDETGDSHHPDEAKTGDKGGERTIHE